MSLSDERMIFTADVAALIYHGNTAHEGHAVALDEVKRPIELAKIYATRGIGILRSTHVEGLGVDLLLYINGIYQVSTDAYQYLGAWWKARRPGQNRWGGDFHNAMGKPKPDGNHFERVPLLTRKG